MDTVIVIFIYVVAGYLAFKVYRQLTTHYYVICYMAKVEGNTGVSYGSAGYVIHGAFDSNTLKVVLADITKEVGGSVVITNIIKLK